MNKLNVARLVMSSAIALALSACGGSSNDDAAASVPQISATEPGDVFALTASNRLVSFNRDTPGTIRTSIAINGLQSGDSLIGIDFRPADGMLYGVGNTGRIYTINTSTATATLKSMLVADATDTTAPFTALAGEQYGVDFNPVADRLRIVSSTGQNLRINVDSGTTTTDGNINGGPANASVTASAYTNSFATTGTTTLFGIDSTNKALLTQSPPNNGTLANSVALGVDVSAVNGFDIDAVTNTGYAIFTVSGARTLYIINLAATSSPITPVGGVGIAEDIRGLALRPVQTPVVYGLSDDGRLVSFAPLTPNTLLSNVGTSGLSAGETVLGIDVRPRDKMLYAFSSAGKVYTIDPATGAATLKSTLVADPADTTAPYTAVTGTSFAVDFNPVADRLRVISNTGLNLRINVDTGATTTDGSINAASATPVVTAGAYTNSFAGTTTTQLIDIDTSSDVLALQNPPNDGTLSTIGALNVNVEGDVGMDIAGGANGLVLAALRASAGGATSLYRVDVATGAAVLINGTTNPSLSSIGTGTTGLRDIAIAIK